ncbi:MAG: hypothetical protein OSJ38_13010, partial [Lachnospiraceae bacterium]|nr:hypothetical protein [Lachnospiraceae bacterium]
CFNYGKTSKELLKEFVNSRQFTSTTDIMNSMKELFSDVLQTVMEAEFKKTRLIKTLPFSFSLTLVLADSVLHKIC